MVVSVSFLVFWRVELGFRFSLWSDVLFWNHIKPYNTKDVQLANFVLFTKKKKKKDKKSTMGPGREPLAMTGLRGDTGNSY
jgi:hypothetical protein